MSSFEYAEMIEMPTSCEMVVLPEKKKRSSIKKLMGKVNGKKLFFRKNRKNDVFLENAQGENGEFFLSSKSAENPSAESYEANAYEESSAALDLTANENKAADNSAENPVSFSKKRKFSFDIVSWQVATIFILAVAILVTNIFWKDSGINNLLKSVFAPQVTTADDREYTAFAAFAPAKSEIEVVDGVMTVLNGGAIYSPCDGVVESVTEVDGKFTVTVNHSDKYKTVITGADYLYAQKGDKVYTAAPVCYSLEGGVQVAMYDENSIISAYALDNGSLVWQS